MKRSTGKSADWTLLGSAFLAYRGGDHGQVRGLFEHLQRILRAYFKMRVGSAQDAEDLAQATLLKIHFARQQYDAAKSLQTCVFTIASRTLIDLGRGSEPASDDLNDVADTLAASQISPEMLVQLQTDLTAALGTLKPMDRQIVYLYAVEGLSMAEIGTILDLTETAVKLRAHRSYGLLRGELSSVLLGIVSLSLLGMA